METIHALQAQNHQVRYFLYGDVINQTEGLVRQSSRTLTSKRLLPRGVKLFLRDIYELYRNIRDKSLIEPIFRDNSIDMVYERLFYSKTTVSACARKYQIPLIVESNAPAEEKKEYWGAPLDFITKNFEKRILQRADAVTVVSTPLKRHYERRGVPSNKIFVLPNGVNEKCFSPEKVSRDIRTELGFGSQVVLGFVGNVQAYHGIELFLPLARAFDSSKHNVHFLIIGSGHGKLRSMLACENLDGLFTLIDPVSNSEIPNYLAAMDICILPHFMWYGSPMKIFEYGAMGKAIIAPNLENIREVLVHAETALLFEPGNMSALTRAVQELVSDEHLRNQLGSAVQRCILANYTWTRNAERIIEIYNQVVS